MPYEFIPVVIGVVFIFGLIGFGLVKKLLSDNERLKMREMIHRERMAAIEKNLPIDDLHLEDEMLPQVDTANRTDPIVWMRLTALCLGLAFFFGGLGMSLAFRIAPDNSFNEMWSIGLLPAMVGFGLLLFYFMTAGKVTGRESNG